jgi:hypothetical protein
MFPQRDSAYSHFFHRGDHDQQFFIMQIFKKKMELNSTEVRLQNTTVGLPVKLTEISGDSFAGKNGSVFENDYDNR